MEELLKEIRETLKDIHKELSYQTKLMEESYLKHDTGRHDREQRTTAMVKMIRDNFLNHPSMQCNPQIRQSLEGILNMMPGVKE